MAEETEFKSLMSQMGVQPLKEREGEKKVVTRRRPRSPAKGEAPQPAPAEGPGVEAQDPAKGTADETVQEDVTTKAAEEDKTAELLGELETAKARIDLQEARIAELEGELAQPPSEANLSAAWAWRGVNGRDEIRRVIQGFTEERLWRKLEVLLKLDRPESARRLLGDRVVLLCPDDCVASDGFVVLTVEPARCEACGGLGLETAGKNLSEELLLHGLREVKVIGGSLFSRRILRGILDSRVKVTPVAGSAFAGTTLPAESEEELWIAWTGSPVEAAQGEWLEGGPMVIEASSIAGMLKATLKKLSEDD